MGTSNPGRALGLELGLATSPSELDTARALFTEYAAGLQHDLCFQGFDSELRDLPGDYAAPRGSLLLARCEGQWAGCCALRPLDSSDYANACEMKRLFVRPVFRRFGLGRMLALDLIDRALVAGYSAVLLDTLDEMEAARGLYASLGFEEVPPFYFNPLPGARYLRLDLNANHDR